MTSKIYVAVVAGIVTANFATAAPMQKARVTQLVQDVKLLPDRAPARPAVLNDEVNQGTAIRTGTNSRSELTFNDLTITRLGANTVFSFDREKRELQLSSGAALIQVPPNAPAANITTAAVSASISGGTAIFDTATSKFMVLEGEGRMWLAGHSEPPVIIPAGNMVWVGPGGHIVRPTTFNVGRVLKTSRLINGFRRLPNLDLILEVVNEQTETVLALLERAFQDIISQRTDLLTQPETSPETIPPPPPPPPPSEFGSPQTITAPAPYPIDSGAMINTDPTITRGGTTDFGTIYRNQTEDGPLATWAFGSTTSFDIVSGFNSTSNPALENVAVFKFQSLELNSAPAISTVGGPTRLGLIGVDGISSSSESATFSFPGLDSVFLATENGPINLGSGITFDGVNRLLLYARGSNGNMTLASQFIDIGKLDLNAEGAIQFGGTAITHNGGSIHLLSGVMTGLGINLESNSKLLSLLDSETGAGGAISLTTTGGDITANGEIEAERGSINISNVVPAGSAPIGPLQAGAAVPTIVLGGSLTAEEVNVASAGNLNVATTASIEAPKISLHAGGNIVSPGDLELAVENNHGRMLDSDASISLTGANISARSFGTVIDNSNGGVITGDASITLNVAGDLTSTGTDEMFFRILNYVNAAGSPAARINGSADITINATNITANSFKADMDGEGGLIGKNATITFNISGTVKTKTIFDVHIEQTESAGSAAPNTGAAAAPDAITFNGGTYNAGNVFTAFMNSHGGIITLNTANVHADVIRVGAFGSDGSLRIGGGSINANTLLKLYAPGSNGVIDFVANVTLNSRGAAAVIAANTVTIENNVVVTITGSGGSALIYTNHANYSGSGGNGSTSGIFAGNGATTHPLASAPPYFASNFNTSAQLAADTSSTSEVTADASSTSGETAAVTRPQKSPRNHRFAASKASAPNTGPRVTSGPRIGLRVHNSTALLDVIADTASPNFSLANHGRFKSRTSRQQVENGRGRNRGDSPARNLTTASRRDRFAMNRVRADKR